MTSWWTGFCYSLVSSLSSTEHVGQKGWSPFKKKSTEQNYRHTDNSKLNILHLLSNPHRTIIFPSFFWEKTVFSCHWHLLNQCLCISLIILCSLHVITTLELELTLSHHKTKIKQQAANSGVQTPFRQII